MIQKRRKIRKREEGESEYFVCVCVFGCERERDRMDRRRQAPSLCLSEFFQPCLIFVGKVTILLLEWSTFIRVGSGLTYHILSCIYICDLHHETAATVAALSLTWLPRAMQNFKNKTNTIYVTLPWGARGGGCTIKFTTAIIIAVL
jgi:hypothetical protein